MEQQAVTKTGQVEKPTSHAVCRPPVSSAYREHDTPWLRRSMSNRALGLFLQTKLRMGAARDQYDQEADRMTVRSVDNAVVQRRCAEWEEDQQVHRKETAGETRSHSPAVESVHQVLREGGESLSAAARSFFEPRFQNNFSDVRIHTGATAAESARGLNALAYTSGRDIVFGAGQYAPGSAIGRKLLAHELTHVIQQAGTATTPDSLHIQRFTTPEHIAIGNEAYQLAERGFTAASFRQSPLFRTLSEGSKFPSLHEKVNTYGDIVADADFFQSLEDLIREHGDRPGQLRVAVLASRNLPHFTPHNIHEWIPQHDFAVQQMLFAHDQLDYVKNFIATLDPLLQAARAAILRNDDDRAERLLTQYRRSFEPQRERMTTIARNAHQLAHEALMRNAFADHYLTDAFSSGHVITPRKEILQEAGVRLDQMPSGASIVRGATIGSTWGELGELRAQARSMAWHDLDNYFGVEVTNKNSPPDVWTACGDNCSGRAAGPHWANTHKMVVQATSESIKDLWKAGLTGVRTTGYRSVLDLVPTPTFKNYPGWGPSQWENQLQYIRGDNAPHITGDQLTPFAVDLHPIEYCTDLEPGCYDRFLLTPRDWIRRYSFNTWVRPWITKIQATQADRYRF